jgi:beta-lactamase class A
MVRPQMVAVRTDRPVQSAARIGRVRLSSRRPPPRYNRANGRRPSARRVLLFLVLAAFGISLLIWRTSPPSRITEIVPATPAISIARTPLPPSAAQTTRSSPPARISTAAAQPDTGLARTLGPAIDQLIAQYKAQGIDRVGLVIEDGRETDTVARNADDTFAAASLYKLFVLWRTQVEIRQGRLLDTTELTLTAQNDDSDEDGYSLGAYGDTVSVADLRRLMITASNNTAAQVLGQYFGWGTIDQLVQSHGFTGTIISGQASTTARDVTRFFDGLLDQTLDPTLTPDDYALMLGLLKDQEVNTKLSTGFPDGTIFAHKTGDLTGVHHDAGVIFLPDGRLITVTVMTAGDYDASVQFSHDVAALLWQEIGA